MAFPLWPCVLLTTFLHHRRDVEFSFYITYEQTICQDDPIFRNTEAIHYKSPLSLLVDSLVT